MTNELSYVKEDLNELKKELAIIKSLLLSFQVREECLEQEMKEWNSASDEVWMNIDNE